jgi:hypothetical protein
MARVQRKEHGSNENGAGNKSRGASNKFRGAGNKFDTDYWITIIFKP